MSLKLKLFFFVQNSCDKWLVFVASLSEDIPERLTMSTVPKITFTNPLRGSVEPKMLTVRSIFVMFLVIFKLMYCLPALVLLARCN